MSKTKRMRKVPKQSNAKKRAAHDPQSSRPTSISYEQYAQHQMQNLANFLWGIVFVALVMVIVYVVALLDVSGCSYLQNPDDVANCRPYSLLERWTGTAKKAQAEYQNDDYNAELFDDAELKEEE